MKKAEEMERAAGAMQRLLDAALMNSALKGTAKFYLPQIKAGITILFDGAAAVRERDARKLGGKQ